MELGQLLHAQASRHATADDAGIEKAEGRLKKYLSRAADADKFVSFGSYNPKTPDMLEATVLSTVAFACVMTSFCPDVRMISEAIGRSDLEKVMSARICLFRLIKRDVIRFKDGNPWSWNGALCLADSTLEWLGLTGPGVPVLYNSATLKRYSSPENTARAPASVAHQPSPANGILSAPELGQRIAKEFFGYPDIVQSVAARTALHLHRAKLIREDKNDPGTPSEVFLVIGNSGVGKTHLVRTLSKATGRCHSITDSTVLTAQGYVGHSCDRPLASLYQNAGGKRQIAEDAPVVAIDEWDKKCTRPTLGNLDVFGQSVQASMLTQIEAREPVSIGGRSNIDRQERLLDARCVLWMFLGAFPGLQSILEKKNGRKAIGFAKATGDSSGRQYLLDALVEYGLLAEFTNRLTAIYRIPDPDRDTLVSILCAQGGILSCYNAQLSPLGCSLRITPAAARRLASYALDTRTFARGMKAVISKVCEGVVLDAKPGERSVDVAAVKSVLLAMEEL